MSSEELRINISRKLAKIDDVNFLKEIYTIIDSRLSDDVYILSEPETKRVNSARKQGKNGELIPDEELQEKVEKWLNTR